MHSTIAIVLNSARMGGCCDTVLDVVVAVLDQDMRWPCFWDFLDLACLRNQQLIPEIKCIVPRITKCY